MNIMINGGTDDRRVLLVSEAPGRNRCFDSLMDYQVVAIVAAILAGASDPFYIAGAPVPPFVADEPEHKES